MTAVWTEDMSTDIISLDRDHRGMVIVGGVVIVFWKKGGVFRIDIEPVISRG